MTDHMVDQHRKNEQSIAQCVQELDHIADQAKRLSEWLSDGDRRLKLSFWNTDRLVKEDSAIRDESSEVHFSLFNASRVEEILTRLQEAHDRKKRIEACMKQGGYSEYIPNQ